MELKSGALLQGGRYKIISVIGQGGFGITYKALQLGLGRYVAIKEFFMKQLCTREGDTSRVRVFTDSACEVVAVYREKFLKEARIIAAFSHPNIVRIHDIFEENNTAYYVMEFLDCGSLSGFRKLPQQQALTYIRQIGSALQYMHAHKTMHLDVKPDNIILRDYGTAVLIDFGISKHYDTADDETSHTPVGISKGYAPVEQFRDGGVSAFSPSSDVYSLAATLYKLLTGITPPESIDLQSGEAELPPYPSGVGESCKQTIARALCPRKQRPQSVDEFLRFLDTEASGDTIKPEDDKKKPKSGVKHSSNKPFRTVLALSVLAVVVLIIYFGGRNTGPDDMTEGKQIADSLYVPIDTEEDKTESDMLYEHPKRYKGTLTLNEGTYVGEILKGLPDGYGIKRYNTGDVYDGQWKGNQKSGKGTYTWKNGDKYEGEWLDDKMNGHGTYNYANGNVYDGQWKENQKSGKGTFTWKNGNKYVGEWKDDKMYGKGTFTWENGNKYVGEWLDDKMNGQGTQYNADGSIWFKGQWADGKSLR